MAIEVTRWRNQDVRARERLLLATIAAEGILAHNTAVELPEQYSESCLLEMLPGYDEGMMAPSLREDLDYLTEQGLLYRASTGHSEYGNRWVEGVFVWRITAAGLVALWTTVADLSGASS